MDYPLISVLVLCSNNQKYLYDSLKSIFSQTYPNLEVIISDDASDNFNGEQLVIWINKNKTENIKKISVYENQFNIGEIASLEIVQSKSMGQYLFNLTAGDVLFDDDVIVNLYTKAQEIGDEALIVVSENEIWDEKLANNTGSVLDIEGIRKIKEYTANDLFAECCLNKLLPPCFLYHRNLLDHIGVLSGKYKIMVDWVISLKAFKNEIRPYYCDVKASVKLRFYNKKISSKAALREWYEIYANEIEPFLDRLDIDRKEIVQKKAENNFRAYCDLFVYDAKEVSISKNIKVVEQKNKLLSYKYKLSEFAYSIFSRKPFFILKKYVKQFGLKELVCKMSTKKAVVINAIVSILMFIGVWLSYFNNFVYGAFIFSSLFILWCGITICGILLHYYLLNR